jgi:uncharacterized protein (DUF433 family)
MLSWMDRIAIDSDTLHGKPRVRHTRIPVSFVLELLAAGHTPERICTVFYPDLRGEDVQACVAFATHFLTDHETRHPEELRHLPTA